MILSQLKQAGFVQSQRGSKGGYTLVRSPDDLTVGEVMRFMQGPIGPVECVISGSKEKCSLYGDCAFLPMWERVKQAVAGVYDSTTFQDLVDEDSKKASKHVPQYTI